VNSTIAVIDTGIDLNYQDELNVTYARNFVPGELTADDGEGHGTHVAGTIAARDNDIGVVGVAPGARLWAIRVLDSQGSGAVSTVISGVDFACQYPGQVQVINLSLGGGISPALNSALRRCVSAGITVVVAAGNSTENAALSSPANESSVITVAALNDTDGRRGGLGAANKYGSDDRFASFSNFGDVVDVIAPGTSILSTTRGHTYATLSGTSMATPHVSGLAALILSQYPGASPQAVRDAIVQNASEQIPGLYSERVYPLVEASRF
jgi:subtilisin family serine protease